MKGCCMTLSTLRSVNAYERIFLPNILSFCNTFIAYRRPSSIFSTRKTYPNAPFPSVSMMEKSFGPISNLACSSEFTLMSLRKSGFLTFIFYEADDFSSYNFYETYSLMSKGALEISYIVLLHRYEGVGVYVSSEAQQF